MSFSFEMLGTKEVVKAALEEYRTGYDGSKNPGSVNPQAVEALDFALVQVARAPDGAPMTAKGSGHYDSGQTNVSVEVRSLYYYPGKK
jgi:hypothetical protein